MEYNSASTNFKKYFHLLSDLILVKNYLTYSI